MCQFFWGISAAKNDGFTNKDVDSSHKHARFTGEHADLIVETTKNEGLEFGVQKSKQGKAQSAGRDNILSFDPLRRLGTSTLLCLGWVGTAV